MDAMVSMPARQGSMVLNIIGSTIRRIIFGSTVALFVKDKQ